ncbi:flavodoxin-dependent (E)-4-hydroxy-3-methylbut-2-enyl-diphosphate synthase [Candidatus Aminicenantes bacterium AH-873-B07]|nr:flavodoxin-dependent (E)-4-hydroxy-3-methylbut-2-enyl-diphosphate synthase [Candidatus Aminicenantes bacterium AH-873-B07]
MIKRRKTRQIRIGRITVGGDAPIRVQSMTKTDTYNVPETVNQIRKLEKIGCEIIRVAVPDLNAIYALKEIKKQISIPLIADIHFDYKLAIKAIEQGVDGLRINPGNIGGKKKVTEILKVAKEKKIPIRIGVNSGSLEKNLLKKYGYATSEAMVESAMNYIKLFEDFDFTLIKISLKAPDIYRTIRAYRLLSEKVDYPLHLGLTEAGTFFSGTVKSSIALGILLMEGIGDTIRVSLTAPPEEEVRAGYEILKSLGLRERGPIIVSCPTCGRLEINNFIEIASEIERRLSHIKEPFHLAIMGCVVNGPGEAKEADFGVACGKRVGIFFKKGKFYKRVKEEEIIEKFVKEVENLCFERKK